MGDRLRAEGMFDEAGAAYDSWARAVPNDAGVALTLALSHAGAGRLDVATRLLDPITRTGGRGDDGRLGELASIAQAVLLAGARSSADAEVEARAPSAPTTHGAARLQSVVMIQSPLPTTRIEVRVVRANGEKVAQSGRSRCPRELGVVSRAHRAQRRHGAHLTEARPGARSVAPCQSQGCRADLDRESNRPRLVTKEVEVSADGKSVELAFDGVAFL